MQLSISKIYFQEKYTISQPSSHSHIDLKGRFPVTFFIWLAYTYLYLLYTYINPRRLWLFRVLPRHKGGGVDTTPTRLAPN